MYSQRERICCLKGKWKSLSQAVGCTLLPFLLCYCMSHFCSIKFQPYVKKFILNHRLLSCSWLFRFGWNYIVVLLSPFWDLNFHPMLVVLVISIFLMLFSFLAGVNMVDWIIKLSLKLREAVWFCPCWICLLINIGRPSTWKEHYRGRIWTRIEFFQKSFFGKLYALNVFRLIVNLGKKN